MVGWWELTGIVHASGASNHMQNAGRMQRQRQEQCQGACPQAAGLQVRQGAHAAHASRAVQQKDQSRMEHTGMLLASR